MTDQPQRGSSAEPTSEAVAKPLCYVVLDADGHTTGTAPHITSPKLMRAPRAAMTPTAPLRRS